jgi:hypothetical protein
MASVSWLQIRPWNGSRSDAFEELCCQLAHAEQPRGKNHFFAKGRPDSGIECFWNLAGEEEWGWQAKFFPDGMTNSRWAQCDKSVKKALAGHSKLTKLFFCFPFKFPDGRDAAKRSGFKLWVAHKSKWQKWAKSIGRAVEFNLWDEHELITRLTKPEHKGRWWFWFETPAFDQEWFKRNIQASVVLADERYSPDLHFDLPLAQHFDPLCRTTAFTDLLNKYGTILNNCLVKLHRFSLSKELSEFAARIAPALNQTLSTLNSLSFDINVPINFAQLAITLRNAQEQVEIALRFIWGHWQKQTEEFRKVHGRPLEWYERRDFSFDESTLREIRSNIETLLTFCSSIDAELANRPSMLLVGSAGLGKTHLVCSVAEKRIIRSEPTVLLLGQQFDNSEPWSQIIRLLGIDCGRDDFLGALNAAGELAKCRSLIIIDAINEGAGLRFWKNHLASMLSVLRNYPYVAIVLSIRRAYLSASALPLDHLTVVEHPGFSGHRDEATRHFFKHFGLAEPNFPLLNPEFDSPLFLKLICRSLKGSGETKMTADIVGVTNIFKFVLDQINQRLADTLDYAPNLKLVWRAVQRLAELMAESGSELLSFEIAQKELNAILPATTHSQSLLQGLISEHILTQSPGFGRADEDVIHFSYQRLSDHLIVEKVLSRTPKSKVRNLFKSEGIFKISVNSEIWFYAAAGWIEALAVLLPEFYGIELFEILEDSFDEEILRRAFINSLIWRKSSCFTRAAERCVQQLFKSAYVYELFDAVISVTARPDHPYNGAWLDDQLQSLSMSERDSLWSIYLFGKSEENSNITRLIEWSWAERKESLFPDAVVRLAGLTLIWCLTTSDRFVRDRATKALVSLFERRINILRELLTHFQDVDDPYVLERLYAVAYGCAMLTNEVDELRKLAQDVYDRIFKNGFPPANVLLRDHARGIIEVTNRTGLKIDYDPKLIVPPYRSYWPKSTPSMKKLERLFRADGYDDKHWGLRRVFHSVTSDDFSRYSLYNVNWWHDQRLSTRAPSPREIFDRLRNAHPEDDETLTMYADKMDEIYSPKSRGSVYGSTEHAKKYLTAVDNYLRHILNESDYHDFLKKVIPYLKNRRNEKYERIFCRELFQRLILHRVLQLGYTNERFSAFDMHVSEKGRSSHKAERIGKKYQWIAFDEFHARISDNFGLAETESTTISDDDWARGLWPQNFRDIDPSLLLKKTRWDGSGTNQANWWTPHQYNRWDSAKTPLDWLRQKSDLPVPLDFLQAHSADGSDWFAMNLYAAWRRKEGIGSFQGQDRDTQEIHYIIRSYVVRQEHVSDLMKWGEKQDWINDRLPSAFSYEQYFRERFWSPYFDEPDEEIIKRVWPLNDLPHPVYQTTSEFLNENQSYDCSGDEGFTMCLPSCWLAKKMKIKMGGRQGDFVDSNGKIIAFDPSTRERGHSTLLIRRSALKEFISRERMAIFWTLLGEKNIYPPGHSGPWLGRLTVLGYYSWAGGEISGDFRTVWAEGHD